MQISQPDLRRVNTSENFRRADSSCHTGESCVQQTHQPVLGQRKRVLSIVDSLAFTHPHCSAQSGLTKRIECQ